MKYLSNSGNIACISYLNKLIALFIIWFEVYGKLQNKFVLVFFIISFAIFNSSDSIDFSFELFGIYKGNFCKLLSALGYELDIVKKEGGKWIVNYKS